MEAKSRKIEHYLTADEDDPFDDWMEALAGGEMFAKVNIRLKRVSAGNFGDHASVGNGVCELRFHNGYRVYYGLDNDRVVLLTGGTKKTQVKDIATAKLYWEDYNSA